MKNIRIYWFKISINFKSSYMFIAIHVDACHDMFMKFIYKFL